MPGGRGPGTRVAARTLWKCGLRGTLCGKVPTGAERLERSCGSDFAGPGARGTPFSAPFWDINSHRALLCGRTRSEWWPSSRASGVQRGQGFRVTLSPQRRRDSDRHRGSRARAQSEPCECWALPPAGEEPGSAEGKEARAGGGCTVVVTVWPRGQLQERAPWPFRCDLCAFSRACQPFCLLSPPPGPAPSAILRASSGPPSVSVTGWLRHKKGCAARGVQGSTCPGWAVG